MAVTRPVMNIVATANAHT